MAMRSFAIVLLVFGLATAASGEEPEKPVAKSLEDRQAAFAATMQTNIGTDINDLIRRVGPPDRQFKMPNGNVVYQFDKSWPGYIVCILNFETDEKGTIVYINVNGCVV